MRMGRMWQAKTMHWSRVHAMHTSWCTTTWLRCIISLVAIPASQRCLICAILQHCRYLVRKQRYEEMTRIHPLKAMQYLRKHIAEVIDHCNSEQLNSFHNWLDSNVKCTVSVTDEYLSNKSDSDITNPTEDLSMESCDSSATASSSGISDTASSSNMQYSKCGDKRARSDHLHELRSRRAFLFN